MLPPVTDAMRSAYSQELSGNWLPCCLDFYCYMRYLANGRLTTEKWIDGYFSHVASHQKSHAGNGKHCGAWAFTLTSSPKDGKTVMDLMTAARKIMSQKSQIVKKYRWYLEYTGYDADGVPTHPHIHGMYETTTGGKIEDKHWRRAWPIWMEKDPTTKKVIQLGAGFRGGYHRPVKSDESYNNYIAKDGGVSESSGLE